MQIGRIGKIPVRAQQPTPSRQTQRFGASQHDPLTYARQQITDAVKNQHAEKLATMLFRRDNSPLFQTNGLDRYSKLGLEPVSEVYTEALDALTTMIKNPTFPIKQLKDVRWALERHAGIIDSEPYPQVRTAFKTLNKAMAARTKQADLSERRNYVNELVERITRLEQGPITVTVTKSDDSYSMWTQQETIPQGRHQYEQRSLAELLFKTPRLPKREIEATREQLNKVLKGKLEPTLQKAFDMVLNTP